MKKLQRHKNIDFINTNPLIGLEYAPKPATSFLPEWYKKMEGRTEPKKPKDFKNVPTIKKCIPVFDAMTSGYIIQTICDIGIEIIDGEPVLTPSLPIEGLLFNHPRKQAYLHPNANEFHFPKFGNFWSIKTPKGYSCLFIPPMHNPNPYFTALPGIVDTDNYNACVLFPFTLNDPTKSGVIPAGTPIVQVIPFKRDSWESKFLEDEKNNERWILKVRSTFFGGYKNKYWTRKTFK